MILGSSELKISNNNIKNNRSSGIAAQYYKSAKKLGDLKISGNKINSNKDFGLTCKAPSGGNPGEAYWSDSVVLVGNAINGNKKGSFAPGCFFGEEIESGAITTEEEKEQKLLEEEEEKEALAAKLLLEGALDDTELTQESYDEAVDTSQYYSYRQIKEKNGVLQLQQQEKVTAQDIAQIAEAARMSASGVDQAVTILASESKIKVYYRGRDPQALLVLEKEIIANEERINTLLAIDASPDHSAVNRETIMQTRAALEGVQAYYQSQKESLEVTDDPIDRFKWFFNL